jgi:hypothetical protein
MLDKHGERIRVGQQVEVQCFLNVGSLRAEPGEVLGVGEEGVRILVTLSRPAPVGPPFDPGEKFEYTVPADYTRLLIRVRCESLERNRE